MAGNTRGGAACGPKSRIGPTGSAFGQWLRVLTRILKVAGAVLVVAPRTVVWAASLLSAIVVGVALTRLMVFGGNCPAGLMPDLNAQISTPKCPREPGPA
ncbi:hypothetical protein AWL63_19675 [Sphingomonas panacis]|uniref:Uncharacterized protein n=1 Tax=Sphingomonas panacis TaxID=1560345 RepID=A0A1B3ZEI5_9SPHN|nr:hypothetical protein [Sphingomonas panacis]AOH85842.1 hypothetical protein AWL63_19675 [Sphingomonas panacis]